MGVKQIRKNCRHEYEYEKFVYEQPNAKPIYSYKKVCNKCGDAKSVKMTSEVFEIVRYKPWRKSVKEVR